MTAEVSYALGAAGEMPVNGIRLNTASNEDLNGSRPIRKLTLYRPFALPPPSEYNGRLLTEDKDPTATALPQSAFLRIPGFGWDAEHGAGCAAGLGEVYGLPVSAGPQPQRRWVQGWVGKLPNILVRSTTDHCIWH